MKDMTSIEDLRMIAETLSQVNGKINKSKAAKVIADLSVTEKAFNIATSSINLAFDNEPDDFYPTEAIIEYIGVTLSTVGEQID